MGGRTERNSVTRWIFFDGLKNLIMRRWFSRSFEGFSLTIYNLTFYLLQITYPRIQSFVIGLGSPVSPPIGCRENAPNLQIYLSQAAFRMILQDRAASLKRVTERIFLIS
jgi:hypothetical protein